MSVTIPSGGGEAGEALKGAARLRRTLKAAGGDLADLKESNTKAAKIVEEATVGLVPVDSGNLARTIRSSGTNAAGVVRVGTKTVPYAGVIHFGTAKAKKVFWQKRHIPANPFAADAAKLTEPTWGAIYQDAVERALDRIKGI